MKIVISKHVIQEKIPVLKSFGWIISRKKIEATIIKPGWRGVTNKGQPTAISLINRKHILLVVYKLEDDIIKVITVYVTRRGSYGSTL